MSMEPDPTRERSAYAYEQPPPAAPQPPFQVAQTNGYAIASLVLGIVGITGVPFIPSLVALFLGYKARRQIDESGGAEHGRGIAIAGIVLGWIGVLIVFLALLVFAIAIIGLGTFQELGP